MNPIALLRHGRSWITFPLAHVLSGAGDRSYIVSFPRSGSTWLRTMLGNLLAPDAESNPNVFNDLIPGVTLSRLPIVWRKTSPLLMTHALNSFRYHKVIYVLRDGRDSIMSFYRYTTTRNNREIRIDDWMKDYLDGYYGPRWDQHVRSWLGVTPIRNLPSNVMVVKYEDLRLDTEEILKNICDFFGLDHTGHEIARAVQMSSVEKMRIWEKILVGDISQPNASFYRGGNQEWASLPSAASKKAFMNKSRSMLAHTGYVD